MCLRLCLTVVIKNKPSSSSSTMQQWASICIHLCLFPCLTVALCICIHMCLLLCLTECAYMCLRLCLTVVITNKHSSSSSTVQQWAWTCTHMCLLLCLTVSADMCLRLCLTVVITNKHSSSSGCMFFYVSQHGVATMSRRLKIIGLFCRI